MERSWKQGSASKTLVARWILGIGEKGDSVRRIGVATLLELVTVGLRVKLFAGLRLPARRGIRESE